MTVIVNSHISNLNSSQESAHSLTQIAFQFVFDQLLLLQRMSASKLHRQQVPHKIYKTIVLNALLQLLVSFQKGNKKTGCFFCIEEKSTIRFSYSREVKKLLKGTSNSLSLITVWGLLQSKILSSLQSIFQASQFSIFIITCFSWPLIYCL